MGKVKIWIQESWLGRGGGGGAEDVGFNRWRYNGKRGDEDGNANNDGVHLCVQM